MVLKTVIETMGGHDINHLKQIEAATAAAGILIAIREANELAFRSPSRS